MRCSVRRTRCAVRRTLTLGLKMNVRIMPIALLSLMVGCAHIPTPSEDAAVLSGTTRITLTSLGFGADEKTIPHRKVIETPEEIRSFVSALQLVPADRSCCCLYSRSAVFETAEGEVHLGVGPHRVFVSHGRAGERMYYMPQRFYTLFENAYGREPAEYKETQPDESTVSFEGAPSKEP